MASEPYALILLDGQPPSADLLRTLSAQAVCVFCADGAARYAREAGIRVDQIVGDLDSLSVEVREQFAEAGTKIEHVSEQYSNDFEKTLKALRREHSGLVRIVGLSGGRLDHTLTNVSVMLKAASWFSGLISMDDWQEHTLLTADRNEFVASDLPLDSIVSLSPCGEAHGVDTHNLMYPITAGSLVVGSKEGLSNRVIGLPITVRLRSGALLVSTERRAL
jgi:thiamine pyrophosphokinase